MATSESIWVAASTSAGWLLRSTLPLGAHRSTMTCRSLLRAHSYLHVPWVLASAAGAQSLQPDVHFTTEVGERSAVAFTDMDGDGDADLLSISGGLGTLTWTECLGSAGFAGQRTLEGLALGTTARSLAVADLNGDGLEDVVVTGVPGFNVDTAVGWYPRVSAFELGPLSVLAGGVESTFGRAADMDQDGDIDIVFASGGRHPTWLENQGGGQFAAPVQISISSGMNEAMELRDLDGDGLPDIVWVASTTNRLFWVRNLGGAQFAPRVTLANFSHGSDMVVVDLNRDGRLDIVTADLGLGEISWVENQGAGSFAASVLLADGIAFVGDLAVGDFDNDGDVDLFSRSLGDVRVGWHENQGGVTFLPKTALGGSEFATSSFIERDLDGDGDEDIVAVGPTIRWWVNDGSGDFSTMRFVTRTAHGLPVDFDLDGDVDVLGITEFPGAVTFDSNRGDGTMIPQRDLVTGLIGARDVRAIDADGDQDLDLVVMVTSSTLEPTKLLFVENLGAAFTAPRRLYTAPPESALSIDAADLDGDGDQDLLVRLQAGFGSTSISTVIWFNNDGSGELPRASVGPFPWLSPLIEDVYTLQAADLDGDGAADLLGSRGEETSEEIVWYRNQGGGRFSEAISLGAFGVEGVQAVTAGDINGDGIHDVLFLEGPAFDVSWIEGLGGGAFGQPEFAAPGAEFAYSITAVDLDSDGDEDPVVYGGGGSFWVESLGAQGFGSVRTIETNTPFNEFVVGVDLDGDLDLDLFKRTGQGSAAQFNQLVPGRSDVPR